MPGPSAPAIVQTSRPFQTTSITLAPGRTLCGFNRSSAFNELLQCRPHHGDRPSGARAEIAGVRTPHFGRRRVPHIPWPRAIARAGFRLLDLDHLAAPLRQAVELCTV